MSTAGAVAGRPLTVVTKRRLLFLIVAGALVAGLSYFAWWRIHPEAFQPYGGGYTYSSDAWPVGRPLFVGMTYPTRQASGSVTVDDVEAHVVSNTAEAEFEYLVCEVNDDADGALGAVDDLENQCLTTQPLEKASFGPEDTPFRQVVLVVTLTKPGEVLVQGIDITYRHGWQHGTQRMGEGVLLRTG